MGSMITKRAPAHSEGPCHQVWALLQKEEYPWCQKYHCDKVFYTMEVSAERLQRESGVWALRIGDDFPWRLAFEVSSHRRVEIA